MALSIQTPLRLATVYTPYLILQPPQGDKDAGTSEGQGAVLISKSPCCFKTPSPLPAEGELQAFVKDSHAEMSNAGTVRQRIKRGKNIVQRLNTRNE